MQSKKDHWPRLDHNSLHMDDSVSSRQSHRSRVKHSAHYPSSSESDNLNLNGFLPDIDTSTNDIANVKTIYTELQEISNKLKEENEILNRREGELSEREEILSVSQSSLYTVTELSVKQRIQDMQQEHTAELERMDGLLKEKSKENRRLRENFDTLKQANDVLKKELELVQTAHIKLEKQSHSLQSRMTNLQRKNDLSQRLKEPSVSNLSSTSSLQLTTDSTKPKQAKDLIVAKTSKSTKMTQSVYDILAVMLDWVSEHRLRAAFIKQRIPQLDSDLDKCVKCLPCLVDILRELPAQCTPRIYLPSLQFIYWSLLHIEQSQTQRSSLVATLRRLGDELYRPGVTRAQEVTADGEKPPESQTFLRSNDLHVRFLSCLIILKTLSQVDLLAHVFDTLRSDLKTDHCKELFLYYHATPTFLPFLRPINKTFLAAAVDIYLQLSADTPFLPHFLETCGNEAWFRSVAMAMRAQTVDVKTQEKLSIVLQKLSKIKSNRKYFEVYTLVTAIQELLRSVSLDQPFLTINLKSILLNVTS